MVDLTPERLQELRRIAEAAVQGDWYICHPNCRQVWVRDDGPLGGWCVAICDTQESGEGFTPEAMDANARHIATFDPPTVLALLDEIERLRRVEWWARRVCQAHQEVEQIGYAQLRRAINRLSEAINDVDNTLALLDGEKGGDADE